MQPIIASEQGWLSLGIYNTLPDLSTPQAVTLVGLARSLFLFHFFGSYVDILF